MLGALQAGQQAIAQPPGGAAAPGGRAAPGGTLHDRFHALLSALNPLQYVPVIGTIYRAVTGDTIPERTRLAGSMLFSLLTGGPVGLAFSAGVTLAEKATGIDPEQIGGRLLASLGVGSHGNAKPPVSPALPAQAALRVEGIRAQNPRAWSRAELAAYGGVFAASGGGNLSDADRLNDAELVRLHGKVSVIG